MLIYLRHVNISSRQISNISSRRVNISHVNISRHVNIFQRPPNFQNKQRTKQTKHKPSRIIDRTNQADKEGNLQSTEANSSRLVSVRIRKTSVGWLWREQGELRRASFGENEANSGELVFVRTRRSTTGWFRRERGELRRAGFGENDANSDGLWFRRERGEI